ncbi:nucleotidyltransferase family protein [Aquimarina sediminis]|uniref:nucleotidyltransferase family protein n=1 Tax=Aquimarina sediminis TaxID=2070536 RepID=UPI000CA06559|nr:nucleotidyltransferase family protein [Aquimarina sediminis]
MSLKSNPEIAHLILAAGSSSRMGEPKQLLPWGDTNLIGHSIQQSLLLKNTSIHVVLGANYNAIYNKIKHFPIQILENVDWESGMGTSIQYGIQWIQQDNLSYDAVLISLIDQPLLGSIHFEALKELFNKNTNRIVATDLGEGVIGVPAIIPAIFFDELSGLQADHGARYVIKKNIDNVKTVLASTRGVDIDTIAEYKNVIKRYFLPKTTNKNTDLCSDKK